MNELQVNKKNSRTPSIYLVLAFVLLSLIQEQNIDPNVLVLTLKTSLPAELLEPVSLEGPN